MEMQKLVVFVIIRCRSHITRPFLVDMNEKEI